MQRSSIAFIQIREPYSLLNMSDRGMNLPLMNPNQVDLLFFDTAAARCFYFGLDFVEAVCESLEALYSRNSNFNILTKHSEYFYHADSRPARVVGL